jgi:GrpB-like predicted nucleotidyltransferase (UPF0157 family)
MRLVALNVAMEQIHVRAEAELRASVASAFSRHRARIRARLPAAEVEHVGSTSIRGALTKGDLDVLVRVDAAGFEPAVQTLLTMYAVHQPDNWTPTYASFTDREADDPPVGVQLVVGGSHDDALFGPFRRAMIADPELLAAYNALKRRYDGSDYDTYTDAKAEFIQRVNGARRDRRPLTAHAGMGQFP